MVLGLFLCASRRKATSRKGYKIACGALFAFLLIAAAPVDDWLMRQLEDRMPRPALPSHIDGIIVLSGGEDAKVSAERGLPSITADGERLMEFVSLARQYPEAKLVFSGGSGLLGEAGKYRQADVARMVTDSMGIDPSRILFERDSRNTVENAEFSYAQAKPAKNEVWVLVTSAYHLPRATGCFHKVGWNVIPYPVGYRSGTSTQFRLNLNVAHAMERVNLASREYVGLLAYWIMGRTDALWPAA